MTYIKWEDNRGQTDYVYKNKFHDQDYYPRWIDADEMTFRGTLLPKNAVDVSGNGSYYLQYMFKYGAYADNYPNEAKDENGNYIGTAAVIDKDLASERLAEDIDADALVILTAVEQVCINFGKPEQKSLATMTVEEARRYMAEGHFAPGSMLPKVEAAVKFVESKPGRKAIITSLDKAVEALEGKAGTTVC